MEASTFIWMFVVLKVPLIAALLLIWWAIRGPEPATEPDDGGSGGSKCDRIPRPRKPRPPRRGPHATPPLPAPRRVRTAATGRVLKHTSR